MKKLFLGMILSSAVISTFAQAAGSDELWEMQTKMDMPGMAMPAMKHTVCLPKGGMYKPEPGPQEKKCEMKNLKVSGNKTSWTVRCTGKEEMEAHGEVTRTADTMNGTLKMAMKDMQMTQVISGKRVGSCEAKQ